MASYTKITNTDVIQILALYGYKTDQVTLTPLDNGISNSNYRLCFDDQTLLLKISNDKNSEELNSEHQILSWLNTQNFSLVIAPHKTLNNQTVYNYLNYTGALFPFIKSEPYQKNSLTMFKLGQSLAKLHMISIDKKNLAGLGIRKYQTVGFGIKQIINYTQKSTCPSDFKDLFNKIYPTEKALALIGLDLPGGVIHGDFYFDNALFFQSEMVAMLDFEQAGIGRFILDLGIAISGSAVNDNKIENDYLKSYLEGYESIRPLTKMEKKLLPDAILVGLFSISLWRIKRFTEGSIDSEKKESYRELLNRAQSYHQGL